MGVANGDKRTMNYDTLDAMHNDEITDILLIPSTGFKFVIIFLDPSYKIVSTHILQSSFYDSTYFIFIEFENEF